MKIRIFMAGLALGVAACNPSKKTTDFIPGTFVNHAESAYSIADDTLVISADRGNSNSYHIIRRTGFQRKNGNRVQAPQYKVKTYTGIWNEQQQTLQLTANGVLIIFHPDETRLSIESSIYSKLKK
jgi:hypothetical protein